MKKLCLYDCLMSIHRERDHEHNLGGDNVELNNIESKFLFDVYVVFMKVDLKEEGCGEINQEPIFFNQ